MRRLQAMMARVGSEFDMSEEGGHVGRIERRRDFFRLDRIRLLDGVLQYGASGWTGPFFQRSRLAKKPG